MLTALQIDRSTAIEGFIGRIIVYFCTNKFVSSDPKRTLISDIKSLVFTSLDITFDLGPKKYLCGGSFLWTLGGTKNQKEICELSDTDLFGLVN